MQILEKEPDEANAAKVYLEAELVELIVEAQLSHQANEEQQECLTGELDQVRDQCVEQKKELKEMCENLLQALKHAETVSQLAVADAQLKTVSRLSKGW